MTATGPVPLVTRDDLRVPVRASPGSSLLVFAVDASDSMGRGARARMTAAKGAAMVLLGHAYVRRERVAMVVCHDRDADVVLPPTRSVALGLRRLASLPCGGATPLAHGLAAAHDLVRNARLRDPRCHGIVVLLSDGEATVPLQPGGDASEDVVSVARLLAASTSRVVFADAGGYGAGTRPSRMADLARRSGAVYRRVVRLGAAAVIDAIWRDSDGGG